MPTTEVRRLLVELETTINNLDSNDSFARDRLSQLSAAIETQLNVHEKVETDALMEELMSTVKELESEHPSATSLLNTIATTLSSIGI